MPELDRPHDRGVTSSIDHSPTLPDRHPGSRGELSSLDRNGQDNARPRLSVRVDFRNDVLDFSHGSGVDPDQIGVVSRDVQALDDFGYVGECCY